MSIPKPKKKRKEKKKRVMFPWLKKKRGRAYKCMLAVLAEKEGFGKVKSGNLTFGKFIREIVQKTNRIFPRMFKVVRKFYKTNGRKLTRKEFENIALGRIRIMFFFDKKEKKIRKLDEHPENSPKLKKSVIFCKKLLKNGSTYDEYTNK